MKATVSILGLFFIMTAIVGGDTFRHKETGEEFYGFRTQQRSGGKMRVYHSEEKKMMTIEESDYDITYDAKGRRDRIVRIAIRQPEALISQMVAERIARTIIDASNAGPLFIVLEIDSPGGRGDYMRIVTDAIKQTTNLPVVAFIPGGQFGGVYSAAAVVALACDAVYIAPRAAIGAVGPMTGAIGVDHYAAFLNLYSADNLVAFSNYVTGLVGKPELALIARALVDKSVSVVEVVDTAGNTHFVQKDNRQQTQTVIRTLTEGVPPGTLRTAGGDVSPSEILGRVLTLSAADAERIGLAERQVSSINEIAAHRGFSDASIANAGDIDATVRRFAAGRRNIGEALISIDHLERYAATLEDQIARVEDNIRTGTVQREVSRGDNPLTSHRRGRVNLSNYYNDFYVIDSDGEGIRVAQDTGRQRGSSRSRRQPIESERIITEQPMVSLEALRSEQLDLLRELVAEYRRVIAMARHWPGALPPELPVQVLEANMNSAMLLIDNIIRFPPPVYPQTQQTPQPSRRRR